MATDLSKFSFEPLDVDNYATWETRMKFLLITKGLWTAIECENEVDPAIDQKALALIGLCVKEHHLTTLKRCNTALEAWQQLEAVYQAKSNARKLQLKKELTMLKMGPGEPLTKFAARAVDIQDQLRAAGYEIADQDVAWAVLAGLPTDYNMMVTVLTATQTEMSLGDILPKLLQVEQQRQADLQDEKALTAGHGNGFRGGNPGRSVRAKTCYYCGKVGHIIRDCRKKRRDEEANGKQPSKVYNAIAL